ncbi:hypothetical protein JTB14_031265 [Gonioctena quinquepunctata]|nr:hypothetical protein JTB14_031265 [Gonioctena quinquepunctata]
MREDGRHKEQIYILLIKKGASQLSSTLKMSDRKRLLEHWNLSSMNSQARERKRWSSGFCRQCYKEYKPKQGRDREDTGYICSPMEIGLRRRRRYEGAV